MKYNGTVISSHFKRTVGSDKLEKMSSSCQLMHGRKHCIGVYLLTKLDQSQKFKTANWSK